MPTPLTPVQHIIDECRGRVATPYYLIDEARLLPNLERIAQLRERSGVRSVLALKCFSTWAVFDLMREYLDGTTASSVYEARLGAEKFGKEVHLYSVAFAPDEIAAARQCASKIIFNSIGQLRRFATDVDGLSLGLRINPGISYSHYDLADPARPHSRLGAIDRDQIDAVGHLLDGAMFHCNCENGDLSALQTILDRIGDRYGALLRTLAWVSLGGGIAFTDPQYPFERFCDSLARFRDRYEVQLYLEPGSAAVAQSGFLVTQVLDIVDNGAAIAIVDAGLEAHLLDFLVYQLNTRIEGLHGAGAFEYELAGRSCLAGDVFGRFRFASPLEVGQIVAIANAADYTIVKKNWFNGLAMPSIVVRRLDGGIECVRAFGYDDYVNSLS